MWSRFVQESENVILRRQYVLYCNLKSSTSRVVASSVVDCAHTLPLPHWFSSRWEFFQLWCWSRVSCFFFLPSWQLASAPACKSTTLYLVSLKYFGEEENSLKLNINFLDFLVKFITILIVSRTLFWYGLVFFLKKLHTPILPWLVNKHYHIY